MEEFQAESLVIISLGAFILPLLAQRIKIPGIVLEIAYGITVGPILGIVETSEFISGLAILGFLLLMFLSGFEIELETFREKGLKTLALPMSIYLLTVATSFYLISSLGYPIFLASAGFDVIGRVGTSAFIARSLALSLSPITEITFADGPTQTIPSFFTFLANEAFSDKKP